MRKKIAVGLLVSALQACGSPPADDPVVKAEPEEPVTPVTTASEIEIDPATVDLAPGQIHDFTAHAAGTTSVVGVNWSVEEPNGGTISVLGRYFAPADLRTGTFHIKAELKADKTKTASAVVTIKNSLATQVAAGAYHSCARTSAGAVLCWGGNQYSQLGNKAGAGAYPLVVQGLDEPIAAVSTGWYHACALSNTGNVYCWGTGIGNGSSTGAALDTATPITGLGGPATAIALGGAHSCAVIAGGTVKCWGLNTAPESTHGAGRHGQLGNGGTANSSTPVAATGINNATGIAAGAYHTCAVLGTGAMKCWGLNGQGELGDGTSLDRLTPVNVQALAGTAVEAKAGFAHTCARLADGTAQCWGANSAAPAANWLYGQVGSGSSTAWYPAPTTVTSLTGGAAIAAGGFHSCATVTSGMKCWGVNIAGALGNGVTTMSDETAPVSVTNVTEAPVSISAGYLHTCAAFSNGAVKCWGENTKGQLGDGTSANSAVPVLVRAFGN